MPGSEGVMSTIRLGDLVRLTALESHRYHRAVISEDLGTVPDGFREAMRDADIPSYRVIHFERRDATQPSPGEYPPAGGGVRGDASTSPA